MSTKKTRKRQAVTLVSNRDAASRAVSCDRLEPTNEKIRAATAKWQKKLRLQDWQVTAKLARRTEFSSPDCYAEINYFHPQKSAIIKILDPIDFVPTEHDTDLCMYDWERSLIHELLHLMLMWIPDEDDEEDYNNNEELSINLMAEALIDLDRELRALQG